MKPKDLLKRKQVIMESRECGHCLKDEKCTCPCSLFEEKNVCSAAGESAEAEDGIPIHMTDYATSGDLIGKIGQKDLHEVLSSLSFASDPRLLVDSSTADDAGIFEIRPGTLLVQTVDVSQPTVDDPYLFGRIAASSSMSNVYAMGGTPVTALSIIGFPINTLPHSVMANILRGGMDAVKEAGAVILGGHSCLDDEIRFGFAMTGTVDKKRLATNTSARPGDILILTKPIGSGLVTRAARESIATEESLATAGNFMSALNREASGTMVEFGVRACTDICGFGLLGHLTRMMKESGVSATIDFDSIPLLPDISSYAERFLIEKARAPIDSFLREDIQFSPEISDVQKMILTDPQISGGLLMSVDQRDASTLLKALHTRNVPVAAIIGEVTTFAGRRVQID